MLASVEGIWAEYTRNMRIVCNVFLYLDRVFVLNRSELTSIWDFAVLLFRNHAMSDPQVESALLGSLLNSITSDRNSPMSEVGMLISRIFQMLTDLKVVERWTYEPVAKATSSFFETKAAEQTASLSVPQYLDYARQCIDGESQRYENYGLEARFSLELVRRVREAVVTAKLDGLLRTGLASLIESEDTRALTLLYGLIGENDFAILSTHWSTYIKAKGSAFLSDVGKEETAIAEIIELKDRLDRIIAGPFGNNKDLAEALKEASESFMNSRQNRSVELLARYVDAQMRGAGIDRTMSVEQLEATLGKVMSLFRFIQGKDSFGHLYKKDLARRLLYVRSSSLDIEKLLVAKLREECGSTYTSHLESMFRDLDVTRETAAAFVASDYGKHHRSSRMEFNTTLISYGIWPSAPSVKVNIPQRIIEEQDTFTEFYYSQHKGRVLKYQQGLGHCVIKARFPLGVKELQVTIPQAVVLTMFNGDDEDEEIAYSEIQRKTGLDDVNLIRTLQSLACGKINVLNKHPEGREVSANDKFSFNKGFASKHQRIRINTLPAGRDTSQFGDDTVASPTEEVSSDSQYRIDAAIVRNLKQHKELALEDLSAAVNEQLKFVVPMTELLKRIGVLMERDFIGKGEETLDHYKYLA